MKLSAYLTPNRSGYRARSSLHDGTEIIFDVKEHDVVLNEKSEFEAEGFVFVEQLGLQDTRAYIELPQAVTEHGKFITVSKYKLFDPSVKIEDYLTSTQKIAKPRKKRTKKTEA